MHKKKPNVSLIIPFYNDFRTVDIIISKALNFLKKNANKFEIIVINDGSKDDTKKILTPFLGDIIYLENKKNKGLPFSLNTGIKKAKGRFIVRVDSDDWVHAEYINILFHHLSLNNNLDAVSCDYILVNNFQEQIKHVSWKKEPIGCGIMFRIENLIKIGLYDERFLSKEDEDLLIRFQKKFKVTNLEIPLYKYRQHNNNMTKNKKRLKKFNIKLKKKHR